MSTLDSHTKDIKRLKASLVDHSSLLWNVQESLSSLQVQIDSLRTALATMQDAFTDELRQVRADHKDQIGILDARIAKLATKLKSIKAHPPQLTPPDVPPLAAAGDDTHQNVSMGLLAQDVLALGEELSSVKRAFGRDVQALQDCHKRAVDRLRQEVEDVRRENSVASRAVEAAGRAHRADVDATLADMNAAYRRNFERIQQYISELRESSS